MVTGRVVRSQGERLEELAPDEPDIDESDTPPWCWLTTLDYTSSIKNTGQGFGILFYCK
jgi:hypothetical protein